MKLANKDVGLIGAGLLCLVLLAVPAQARTNFQETGGLTAGVRSGAMLPDSDLDGVLSLQGSGFLRYWLMERLQVEVGGGYGRYTTTDVLWEFNEATNVWRRDPGATKDYYTHLSYIQARLLYAPLLFDTWVPYVYSGGGYTYFNVEKEHTTPRRGTFSGIGSTLGVPIGVGVRYELGNRIGLEGNVEYTFTWSDKIDEHWDRAGEASNDHFMQMSFGLTYDIALGTARPPVLPPVVRVPPVIPEPPPIRPVDPPVDVLQIADPPPARYVDYIFPVITFQTASNALAAAERRELDAVAGFLMQDTDVLVDIHGHTDSVGFEVDNVSLSWQRAYAVKDYLVDRGVEPWRLRVEAYGSRRPVASNETEEGRRQNRRVELVPVQ